MNAVAQSSAGYLIPDKTERTTKVRQSDITKMVDINVAKLQLNLSLPQYGFCSIDFSRNGRYLVIGGQKGNLFSCDFLDKKPFFDVQLPEQIRDVHYLQNEVITAVAHPKYVSLYDKQGIQIQVMKDHIDVNRLDYLPYHFLLCTIVCSFLFSWKWIDLFNFF